MKHYKKWTKGEVFYAENNVAVWQHKKVAEHLKKQKRRGPEERKRMDLIIGVHM